MKSLLYFEYKKNRTISTILLIIVILFAVTNLVVFLASQQSSVVSVSFALDQVNYQEAGE
ncbi:unknown [Bacillus sp. CAG:988]|nr:unknown [Bacillus sp. CAG:988]